ncbi:MAG: bifunctional chorismate mutase/prephenate dehydratase [Lentisphaerae bacterium]|mgnify:CR=1 FL=1|jgi:chorismate mutase/prephenate dehydratase|nr:bifunctional chorismate mutase/prephenate dehydratase [Lentisphaerota bacterium]
MDLNECREKINAIDDSMLKLFVERMQVARDVAQYKQEHHIPVSNPTREREILVRMAKAAGPDLGGYIQRLYTMLFEVSRAYQHELKQPNGGISTQIKKAYSDTPAEFPNMATVAVQGTGGAYSEFAAERFFGLPEITWVRSFSGVAQAVEKGLCKYGILPVENSNYGTVGAVYDLMQQHKFHVVRSLKLHIAHALLALPGAKLENIKEIVSHEQALGQCEKFLNAHPSIKVTAVENTAVAAKMVVESNRNDIAAIAGKNCAKLYNLAVLSDDVQNSPNNYTRFICIAKDLMIFPGASRISLLLSLPHRPGALYSAIAKFAALGLNLLKLESRPMPGSDFEFRFYFDVAVTDRSPAVLRLMDELEAELENFTFLGWYSEV